MYVDVIIIWGESVCIIHTRDHKTTISPRVLQYLCILISSSKLFCQFPKSLSGYMMHSEFAPGDCRERWAFLWASGVLDKCVPGYYHRRAEDGSYEHSTCVRAEMGTTLGSPTGGFNFGSVGAEKFWVIISNSRWDFDPLNFHRPRRQQHCHRALHDGSVGVSLVPLLPQALSFLLFVQ